MQESCATLRAGGCASFPDARFATLRRLLDYQLHERIGSLCQSAEALPAAVLTDMLGKMVMGGPLPVVSSLTIMSLGVLRESLDITTCTPIGNRPMVREDVAAKAGS